MSLEPITFIQPIQSHKTKDISKSEWRTLFTPAEALRFREAVKHVDDNLSFLPNGTIVDNACGLEGIETLTWRQILQLSFDEWADARLINVGDQRVIVSATALGVVGILDAPERTQVLLQGVPIA